MPERLTESLIELEKLDTRRAEEALDRQVLQGGALDTSLLELQLADEATVIEGLQAAYQLVVATPEQACAPADPKALRMFPEPWAKKHMLAPLALAEDGEHLEVLSPGPLDAGLLSRLGELLEISLIPVLAPEFRVWQRLARLYDIEPPERFAQLIQEHGVAIESPVQESLPTPPPASEPPRESDKATLGFSEAVNELRDAADRDDIVRTTLRYAITDLEVVAMFINHDDHLEGWMGRGPGTDLIPHLKVDLTANSAFRVVLDTQAHYLGPLPSDEAHTELLAKLGRARPRGVLIVPIRIRNRTVALLYGENGSEPIAPRLAADLMLFTTHLQMALEGLLMRKKAESLSELRPSDSQAPRRTASGVNGPWASEVPSQLPVVPTTPGLDASDDTERGRPPPLEPADDTDKYAKPEPVKASETEAQPAQPEAEIAEPEPLQDEVIITEPEPEPEPPQDEVIITEPEPEMATEAETQPEPEMATEAETQPEPEMATEAETQLEPESQPEPEAEVQPEAEPEPEAEPVAAQVSLLSRSDSWAQATLQPEEEDEAEEITDHDAPPAPADHPLIGGDDEWTSVKTSQLDQALDATISAAQDAAMRLPDVPGVFDRSALATSLHGQELLNELDELTSSLEEAVARSEATAPEDPTAAAGDDWDSVDIDEWPEPEASEPTHPVTQIPTELAPAPQAESELPTQEPASTASARASLTEDATLPDLSAEAWIRASSEIVRPRALPQEVMEAAARPAEPEPVPLTRITIGRQRVETPRDLQEVHPQQASDDRYEVPPTPAEGMDGTVPIFLGRPSGGTGEEVPIPLTDADRITADEPVPLTQLSSGGYRAAAPGPEDPFGHDPALYDDGAPEEPSLEQALEPQPRAASHLRAVPAPTQPVDTAQLHAARVEQEALQWLAQLEQGDAGQQLAAADALTAMGAEVLPHVGQRFPGPLTVDPFRPDAELPPFTKCGPLLSVLERLGRDAHPYVLRHLDAPSPHHRFFAIYFYGAVYVPEAIPRLIQRLHDEEPRSCMLAARTLFSYREHPDFASVQDHLHGRLMATSAIARRHACYLVGLFRDVTAIPKLIDILDRKDKGMSEVAEDALAEITKQRLGLSAKKWKLWWSKNRGRSRIAWLVDGLAARDEALRRSASEELRAVTGLDMGFDENAPKRQREEARQRWIKWWREQERVANP